MERILNQIISFPDFKQGDKWKRQLYQTNEIIVKVGNEGESFFFVEEGLLRVTSYVKLEGNKQMQTGISDLHAGDFFGESCINRAHKRIATVTAVTDCRLLEIYGKGMSDFLDKHPEIGYTFYKALFDVSVERLNNANIRVGNLMAWGLKVHEIDKYL